MLHMCTAFRNEIKKVFWMFIFENCINKTMLSVPTTKLKGFHSKGFNTKKKDDTKERNIKTLGVTYHNFASRFSQGYWLLLSKSITTVK